MIIYAEPRIAARLAAGEGEMITVAALKVRQVRIALRIVHAPVEQQMREPRAFRQHGGNVGIARRQLLGDDAGGERIDAGAAAILRQRQAAQAHLRGLVEQVDE